MNCAQNRSGTSSMWEESLCKRNEKFGVIDYTGLEPPMQFGRIKYLSPFPIKNERNS